MLNKTYIVYKVKGSSFGQIINIKTRRRYVFVRIPRKYLTLNTLKYIDDMFMFGNFATISLYTLRMLKQYISNGKMVNLAQYLKQTYMSSDEEISWVYVK